MAKKPEKPAPKTEPEIGTGIATFAPALPVVVFQSPEQLETLLGKIRDLVRSFKPDLTTAKGRDEIKSLAYKVTRTKTALDDAGKELNAERRAAIDVVDEQRRAIRTELDALRDEARAPLDAWEAAEAARVAIIEAAIETINNSAILPVEYTSDDLAERIRALEELEFDADQFQDWLAIAVAAKTKALGFLKLSLIRTLKSEKDAADLAELLAANAERERLAREADAAQARDRAEIAEYALAREQAEAELDRRAEAERARVAQAEAAERARQNAEAERQAEAASIAASHARAEAQAAIDAAEAEAEALRVAEAARLAELEAARLEQAARDADRAHRGSVMKAAKEAIIAQGVKEPEARAIVLAIVAGEIPNVKLTF
jgi:colicin import membrane protein